MRGTGVRRPPWAKSTAVSLVPVAEQVGRRLGPVSPSPGLARSPGTAGLHQGPSVALGRGGVCACISQGLVLLVGFLVAVHVRKCVTLD